MAGFANRDGLLTTGDLAGDAVPGRGMCEIDSAAMLEFGDASRERGCGEVAELGVVGPLGDAEAEADAGRRTPLPKPTLVGVRFVGVVLSLGVAADVGRVIPRLRLAAVVCAVRDGLTVVVVDVDVGGKLRRVVVVVDVVVVTFDFGNSCRAANVDDVVRLDEEPKPVAVVFADLPAEPELVPRGVREPPLPSRNDDEVTLRGTISEAVDEIERFLRCDTRNGDKSARLGLAEWCAEVGTEFEADDTIDDGTPSAGCC